MQESTWITNYLANRQRSASKKRGSSSQGSGTVKSCKARLDYSLKKQEPAAAPPSEDCQELNNLSSITDYSESLNDSVLDDLNVHDDDSSIDVESIQVLTLPHDVDSGSFDSVTAHHNITATNSDNVFATAPHDIPAKPHDLHTAHHNTDLVAMRHSAAQHDTSETDVEARPNDDTASIHRIAPARVVPFPVPANLPLPPSSLTVFVGDRCKSSSVFTTPQRIPLYKEKDCMMTPADKMVPSTPQNSSFCVTPQSHAVYSTPVGNSFYSASANSVYGTPVENSSVLSTPGNSFFSSPLNKDASFASFGANQTSTPVSTANIAYGNNSARSAMQLNNNSQARSSSYKSNKSRRVLGPLLEASHNLGIAKQPYVIRTPDSRYQPISSPSISSSVTDENAYGKHESVHRNMPSSPQHSRVLKNTQNILNASKRSEIYQSLELDGIKPFNCDEPFSSDNYRTNLYSNSNRGIVHTTPSFTRHAQPEKVSMEMMADLGMSLSSPKPFNHDSIASSSYVRPENNPKSYVAPEQSTLRATLLGEHHFQSSNPKHHHHSPHYQQQQAYTGAGTSYGIEAFRTSDNEARYNQSSNSSFNSSIVPHSSYRSVIRQSQNISIRSSEYLESSNHSERFHPGASGDSSSALQSSASYAEHQKQVHDANDGGYIQVKDVVKLNRKRINCFHHSSSSSSSLINTRSPTLTYEDKEYMPTNTCNNVLRVKIEDNRMDHVYQTEPEVQSEFISHNSEQKFRERTFSSVNMSQECKPFDLQVNDSEKKLISLHSSENTALSPVSHPLSRVNTSTTVENPPHCSSQHIIPTGANYGAEDLVIAKVCPKVETAAESPVTDPTPQPTTPSKRTPQKRFVSSIVNYSPRKFMPKKRWMSQLRAQKSITESESIASVSELKTEEPASIFYSPDQPLNLSIR